MNFKNDPNLTSSLSTSDSVELSAPVRSTPIAPSQSQQISHISSTDRPVLKLRDRAADQRIEVREREQVQRSKDFLTEARQSEAELNQLLHVESQKLAQAIVNAPYRFRELVVENIDAHGYDYADIKASNAAIRALWSLDD